ncbi:diacylglycerol kinase family protein [Propionibacteriaceae bacterium G1746]|uniref:diacylglycerol kinase family protein n=1 Tax=Aestuariimicrobium sp. G57 TaxID=3418485 RepID=UPI003C1BABDF
MRVSKFALTSLALTTALVVVWTWLAMDSATLRDFDTAMRPPRLGGAAQEIVRALQVVTMPQVLVVASFALGALAWQRRLRNLAFALALAPTLVWALSGTIRRLVGRDRPPQWYEHSFAELPLSYPDSHVAVATTFATMLVVSATVVRSPWRVLRARRAWSVTAVVAVALVRWLAGAVWASDIIGAVLVGLAASSAAGAVSGVVRQPVWFSLSRGSARPAEEATGVCAVVYNPAKVGDEQGFRRRIAHECAERGWSEPRFLTTTPDDPGYAMTRDAIAAHPDLVLVAGGDGTVRVVCSELAHTGINLGIVPAGTANLLARNLGVPLDEVEALTAAFDGQPTPTDLVKVTIDGDRRNAEHFAVMGGLGIDGKVMADTNAQLKKAVKSVAYFVAVAQNLNTAPVQASVTLDGKLVNDNPATLMLVGNVAEIQAGLAMFPHGSAHDGELDLIVTGPSGLGQWVKWGLRLLRKQSSHQVTEMQGKHVEIRVAEPMPYQFDGDTLGRASTFEAEVVPAAISVMLPHR